MASGMRAMADTPLHEDAAHVLTPHPPPGIPGLALSGTAPDGRRKSARPKSARPPPRKKLGLYNGPL